MIRKNISKILRKLAIKDNTFEKLYLKLENFSGAEYAKYLKESGFFYSMGDDCHINLGANITDPKLVKIGNNVVLSDCSLFCHDGVVKVLNGIYKEKFDSVGKIIIGDNVFIGHGAIIMPNVTIGSNCIVAAGAIVTKDVASGDIVGGAPAKVISTTDELAKKLRDTTASYPWASIIYVRDGSFDAVIEDKLTKLRQEYFFSEAKD